MSATQGNIFKLKRGGPGSASTSGSGGRKNRGYYVALRSFLQQSRLMGWQNGVRIKKGKTEEIKRKEHGIEVKA